MRMIVKKSKMTTGGPLIALIHDKDAKDLNLKSGDRVQITTKKDQIVCVIDVDKGSIIETGEILLFYETSKLINDREVEISYYPKPKSIEYIKKKLKGIELEKEEIYEITKDIVQGNLTETELTYFVSANYIHEMSMNEVVATTNAMVETGERLIFNDNFVTADKHCIGGVAGNRTTPIVVPIVACAGVRMPKTSSRSITSPSGTADTMEVMCNVDINIEKMKEIISKENGCLVWGGASQLAPADDKIIKIEHAMSLDPTGQLLASILAKKKSVSATHILIDIPWGKGAKIEEKAKALKLKKLFETLGRRLDMYIKVVLTSGVNPIGRGIGPSLEAKDILYVLSNDSRAPKDLKEKSLEMAGEILEMAGKVGKGKGIQEARKILESGQAYNRFIHILKLQGLKNADPDKIPIAKYKEVILANKTGQVLSISNDLITKAARATGAPFDKAAGIFIHKQPNELVNQDEVIFSVYAESEDKLNVALEILKDKNLYKIK